MRKYLPDYEEPEKFIPRDWLFAIVNKVDSTFFKRAVAEVGEVRKKSQKEESKVTTLVVQPDLLKIIREARQQTQSKDSHGTQRALTSLLTSKKKRKRREMEEPIKGLKTELVFKRQRLDG